MAGALGAALTVSLLAGCGKKDDPINQAATQAASAAAGAASGAAKDARPGIAEVKAIAEEGFIYGLPIVMNYAVMYDFAIDKNSGQFKAPFNQIFNEARVFTWQDTAVITPNSDTPYSLLWMDLRAEPMVLSVPAVDKKRYYAVQLTDGNTFNFGYLGTRATGPEAGDYMVVGPNWKGETPAGIKKVFQSTTDFSLALFRTQLFDPKDMPNVQKVQAGYQARPLSAFLKQLAPPAAPAIDFPKIDQAMVKTNFFEYLDFALQFAPPGPEEEAIRAKLATIGIGPGKKFNFKDLSVEHKAAILLAMKEGEDKVDKYLEAGQKNINGWKVGSLFGDRAFYNGDWLKRAAAAKGFINATDCADYLVGKGLPFRTAYRITGDLVAYCVENSLYQINLSQDVYQYVAECFVTTPKRVERNIRTAIEAAWSRGNIEAQHRYFGNTVSQSNGRPTNKEFIANITDRIVTHLRHS